MRRVRTASARSLKHRHRVVQARHASVMLWPYVSAGPARGPAARRPGGSRSSRPTMRAPAAPAICAAMSHDHARLTRRILARCCRGCSRSSAAAGSPAFASAAAACAHRLGVVVRAAACRRAGSGGSPGCRAWRRSPTAPAWSRDRNWCGWPAARIASIAICDVAVGAVLEADRHRQARGQLAVDLALGGARADRAPADQVGDVLRRDRCRGTRSRPAAPSPRGRAAGRAPGAAPR